MLEEPGGHRHGLLGQGQLGTGGRSSGGGTGTEGGLGAGQMSSQVAGQHSGAVSGVVGVKEGVHALAVGAVGNQASLLGQGIGGVEIEGVLVELEVQVRGVVGVDEGVYLAGGLLGLEEGLLLLQLRLDGGRKWAAGSGSGRGSHRENGLFWLGGELFDESSGVLSTGGNVGSVQDAESFASGRVAHGVGLSVVADVRVLSNPVSVVVRLFAEDDSVLGGEGCAGTAVAGVEALLLQDLGQLGIHILGGGVGREHAGSKGDLWKACLSATTRASRACPIASTARTEMSVSDLPNDTCLARLVTLFLHL